MRFLFILIFLPQLSSAQIGMDQWRLHVPNKKALDIVTTGNLIYTAFDNGVLEYDLITNESSMWNNVNGLSDISVSCLGHESVTKSVFIGYENGNIDQLRGSEVANIPGILLAQIPGDNKVYKFVEHNGFVYCATGVGIVKIDPNKSEVKDSYYPTSGVEPILDVAFRGDSIFAVTKTRLYRGFLQNPALADAGQWITDARVPILSGPGSEYQEIEVINSELYLQKNALVFSEDSVFRVTNSGLSFASPTIGFSMEVTGIGAIENRLTVFGRGITIVYNPTDTYNQVFNNYGFASETNANNLILLNGIFWMADDNYGLVKYASSGSSERIIFEGPPRNEFYAMDWYGGTLAVVPGGIKGIVPIYTQPGIYFFEDEVWTYKRKEDEALWQVGPTHDHISVSINPTNPNQVATGTYSEFGMSIVEVDEGVTEMYTSANSTLTQSSGWNLVSDLQYDKDGNLWVLNGFSTEPLKLKTPDNEWYSFSLGTNAVNKQSRRILLDNNENIWISMNNYGLFGYNSGEDITDPSDDKVVSLTNIEGQGGLPSKEVTAIAVDLDNEIWVGTENGFAVVYNAESIFDASPGTYDAQQIKLDFEGNVEYVLGETFITDIEVDGGNRKWMGTNGAGLVLLSPDGVEILKQFNVDNSPLISNNIIDMEIDKNTGELFIITDKGLVSYRSDASQGRDDYENVEIFPNPARPEFEGPITIQGIKTDSDVRITDVAGNLVYKTTSNGGTATWNGLTIQGEKVSTGVYLIWTAPNEGKGRFVGKVLVVN